MPPLATLTAVVISALLAIHCYWLGTVLTQLRRGVVF